MSGKTIENRSPFGKAGTSQFNRILKEVKEADAKKKVEQAKRE